MIVDWSFIFFLLFYSVFKFANVWLQSYVDYKLEEGIFSLDITGSTQILLSTPSLQTVGYRRNNVQNNTPTTTNGIIQIMTGVNASVHVVNQNSFFKTFLNLFRIIRFCVLLVYFFFFFKLLPLKSTNIFKHNKVW